MIWLISATGCLLGNSLGDGHWIWTGVTKSKDKEFSWLFWNKFKVLDFDQHMFFCQLVTHFNITWFELSRVYDLKWNKNCFELVWSSSHKLARVWVIGSQQYWRLVSLILCHVARTGMLIAYLLIMVSNKNSHKLQLIWASNHRPMYKDTSDYSPLLLFVLGWIQHYYCLFWRAFSTLVISSLAYKPLRW